MPPNATPLDRSGAAPAAREVADLLASGDSKAALKRARQIHRASPTGESAVALAQACLRRIAALLERGLLAEAATLAEIIRSERLPLHGDGIEAAGVLARAGHPEYLLGPLADPDLAEGRRLAIERTIRRLVDDPSLIAGCSALAPEHPLRAAAADIDEALQAVTSGPVRPEQLALPRVARRSPLADWKLLVRAIAMAYGRNREECERCLGLIDPASAPAGLVAVVRAMGGPAATGAPLSGPARELLRAMRPDQQALRDALGRLDEAFRGDDLDELRRCIRDAVKACEHARPDLLEALRQRIGVLGAMHDAPVGAVAAAMRGPSLKNARFWRLYARAMEVRGDCFVACAAWVEFARHAVHEGWFAARGPEDAALYRRMAGLLRQVPASEFEMARKGFTSLFPGFASMYADQPKPLRDLGPRPGERPDFWYVSPGDIYRRAVEIEPRVQTFQEWFQWAVEVGPHRKEAASAARAWHEAFPGDARPLLHLVHDAERRGALRKALEFLDLAEAADGVDPKVRRARYRLCVARVIRHLCDRKLHLAEQALEQLRALPQACEGERAALVAAASAAVHQMSGRLDDAEAARVSVARRVGSERAGAMLLDALALAGGHGPLPADPPAPTPSSPAPEPGGLSRSIAGVCVLAAEVGIDVDFPSALRRDLVEDLGDLAARLEPRDAVTIAEAAHERGLDLLAYVACGAGLRHGATSPLAARLLVLRAESLPAAEFERTVDCLLAAGTLARRGPDAATVSRAHGVYQSLLPPSPASTQLWAAGLERERLAAVIERERQARVPPGTRDRNRRGVDAAPLLFEDPAGRPVPRPRRKRRRPGASAAGGAAAPPPQSSRVPHGGRVPASEKNRAARLADLERILCEVAAGRLPDLDDLARTDPELTLMILQEAARRSAIEGARASRKAERRSRRR